MLLTKLRSLAGKTYRSIRKIPRNRFQLARRRWAKVNGDKTLRVNYDLNSSSVVFDLGGYKGDFAYELYKKYGCTIYIFEPVESFYNEIVKRFQDTPKIKVFNFGLSNKDELVELTLSNDASSTYLNHGKRQVVTLKKIGVFIRSIEIDCIDLMKINIEGGEFDVLPALINEGLVEKVDNLQIQFHTFIPRAIQKRKDIRKQLRKTHALTYDYWFIWENWKLKNR